MQRSSFSENDLSLSPIERASRQSALIAEFSGMPSTSGVHSALSTTLSNIGNGLFNSDPLGERGNFVSFPETVRIAIEDSGR